MAYNFYPNYGMYQQQYTQQQPQQIQNGGFVSVRSIEEAFNWPVAPGNSITFKDENSPFVYTKTKGFSPLEQPVFEKYRLVKVEEQPQKAPEPVQNSLDYEGEIKSIWKEINALKRHLEAPEKEGEHVQSTDDSTV